MRPQVNRITMALAVAPLLALLVGCAVFGPKREYAIFREITQTTSVARLVELYDMYTIEFPDGAHAEELARMRPDIEREIFMAAGEDQYKLATYVELFPDGIYTQLAIQKIDQIQYMEQVLAEQQAAQLLAQQAAAEAAAKLLEQKISLYASALEDWIDLALVSPYGKQVSDLMALSPEFLEIWSSEPLAQCDQTSCLKHMVLETWYQIPGSSRVDRKNELIVKMLFAGGGLLGFSVTFPDRGLVPLMEMRDQAPYDVDADTLEMASIMAYEIIGSLMPEGSESGMEGALWAWSVPGANVAVVREGQLPGPVMDSLVVQLVPPPEPEPEPEPLPKGVKPKKKPVEPPPPLPPMATVEQLLYHPALPLLEAAPVAPLPPPAPPVPAPPPLP